MGFDNMIKNYKKNISYGGNTNKEQMISSYLNNINNGFFDSLSYFKITKGEDYQTFYDTWILDENSYKKDIGEKKILMKPGQDLQRGELINWNNQKWLVTEIDPQVQYYNNGTIKKCNYLLKWVNPEGLVRESWCIVENRTLYSTGMEYDKYTIKGDTDLIIKLPLTEETRKFKRLQRFIVANTMVVETAFRITQINDYTSDGLVILNLEEADISHVNDNLDEKIADYYSNTGTYTLTINNGEDITIPLNQTLQLYPKLFKNSIEIPNQTYTYVSSDITKATVSTSGLITPLAIGDVSIIVKWSNDASVTNTLNINIVNNVVVDEYSIFISGNNILQKDITNTYTATVYKNGIVDNTKSVVWSISDNTKASIVSSTGTICKIKGLVNSGSFVLAAVGDWDSSVSVSLNITCKSIFG